MRQVKRIMRSIEIQTTFCVSECPSHPPPRPPPQKKPWVGALFPASRSSISSFVSFPLPACCCGAGRLGLDNILNSTLALGSEMEHQEKFEKISRHRNVTHMTTVE